jgi:hypothetical protein
MSLVRRIVGGGGPNRTRFHDERGQLRRHEESDSTRAESYGHGRASHVLGLAARIALDFISYDLSAGEDTDTCAPGTIVRFRDVYNMVC